ncbi:hypothetical protein B0H21DRAFT_884345 [Amylocystis lapponica]|nr:hypothetical protein B0H21DRAFT_884345 [Amylocystis lapponica]
MPTDPDGEGPQQSFGGAAATIASDAPMNPFDVIKQRMQVHQSEFRSAIIRVQTVYRTEDLGAFYVSCPSTLTMNVSFTTVQFTAYEQLKTLLNPSGVYSHVTHMLSALRRPRGCCGGRISRGSIIVCLGGTQCSRRLYSKHATTQRAEPVDDDWAFDMEPTKPSTQHTLSKPTEDDWGLNKFTSKLAPMKDTFATKSSGSLWDYFDDFESAPAPPSNSHHSPQPLVARSRSPGDFDFGNREDRLLDDSSNDEDVILGNQSARVSPSPQSQPHGQPSRPVSPPPHIVGQIVEMGFTPQQARVALAATDTGLE